ncbi:hypothetical protein PFISCL1PPCAC_11798, partial [Pristionchus fissidentatus]
FSLSTPRISGLCVRREARTFHHAQNYVSCEELVSFLVGSSSNGARIDRCLSVIVSNGSRNGLHPASSSSAVMLSAGATL